VSLGGLDRCACKRGFFTLRDCENPATTTCSICSRRVCDQHLAPRVDVKVCAECAARQEETDPAHPVQPAGTQGAAAGAAAAGGAAAMGPPLQRLDPTSFAVRRRFRYYRSYGYSPMWWGTPDPFYNDWGYRWYGDDDDDDDGGGFGDS
jgi:hypothetical protein